MSILGDLKTAVRPLRLVDPDFGKITFIRIKRHPERSYWEGELALANGMVASICIPGDEDGPSAAAREFYLKLPERFDGIVETCRPKLEQVFREWRQQDLPENILSVLSSVGFDVENPGSMPVRWGVTFETKGNKWLGIAIPFVDDSAGEAIVDT